MKNINLLVWVTQLGLSVVAPLAGFVLLAVWLQNRFSFGSWILIVCIVLGIFSALAGLINSLKILAKLSSDRQKQDPPLSFNDHD